MRLSRAFCVLAVAGLSATATAAAGAVDTPPGVLGVVSAQSGTLAPAGGARLALTLHGVTTSGIWFTDRPAHDAGTAPVSRLVEAFFGLREAAPNGALAVAGRDGATVVVELSHPRSADGGRTLRFTARTLEDVPDRLGSFGAKGAVPRRFGRSTLFIDSQDQNCQVNVAAPSTSTLVPNSISTSHSFGTSVDWNVEGNGISAGNWGEMFYGCGSTLTATYQDATVATGSYTVSVTWNNPMTGTNSSSCTATAQDGSPVPCNAGDVPDHGGQIVFGYGVDNAATPYSGPLP
jgi:hypothetical protein